MVMKVKVTLYNKRKRCTDSKYLSSFGYQDNIKITLQFKFYKNDVNIYI